MPEFTLSDLPRFVGQELGVSSWVTVDQSRIDQFAECSGDRQWIHVDVERAKRESPYRAPIAHGYLTLSLVAPLQMEIGAVPTDAGAAFNYGLDKVRFLAPVKAGARVRLRVALIDVEQEGRRRRPQDQQHVGNRGIGQAGAHCQIARAHHPAQSGLKLGHGPRRKRGQ